MERVSERQRKGESVPLHGSFLVRTSKAAVPAKHCPPESATPSVCVLVCEREGGRGQQERWYNSGWGEVAA